MPLGDDPGNLIETAVVSYLSKLPSDAIVNKTSGAGQNVFVREQPEILKTDPSPVCVVVVGNEREPDASLKPRTNATWALEYPVLVLLAKKVALNTPRADRWKRYARYEILKLLKRHFLLGQNGVVRRCLTYNPTPRFTTIGFLQDFKVSGQLFVYRTEVNRTT
jgi:uncharacterized protein (DUF849 family)